MFVHSHKIDFYIQLARSSTFGQFLGAIIMFGVLGFLPGWVVAKVLHGMDLLRVPKEIELMGLDFASNQDEQAAADDVREAEKALV